MAWTEKDFCNSSGSQGLGHLQDFQIARSWRCSNNSKEICPSLYWKSEDWSWYFGFWLRFDYVRWKREFFKCFEVIVSRWERNNWGTRIRTRTNWTRIIKRVFLTFFVSAWFSICYVVIFYLTIGYITFPILLITVESCLLRWSWLRSDYALTTVGLMHN